MIKNIVSVTAAILGAGALLTGCNFDQPGAGCIVQDASFANWVAQYELKPDQNIPETCHAKLVKGIGATYDKDGEVWGVFKFVDPDKANSTILTIRPRALYSRATLDPNNGDPAQGEWAQTAVGSLAEEPDATNFCTTSNWREAKVEPRPAGQVRPEVPPTTTITYQFENVRLYAAPDAPGTQIVADLKYTRDECSANYTARAIWPAVPCNPDAKGSADKCGEGSGINPNFAVKCDTSFRISNLRDETSGELVYPGTCVARKEIPSFVGEDDEENEGGN